jgi:hypothetical protein
LVLPMVDQVPSTLARRLEAIFQEDLKHAKNITYRGIREVCSGSALSR